MPARDSVKEPATLIYVQLFRVPDVFMQICSGRPDPELNFTELERQCTAGSCTPEFGSGANFAGWSSSALKLLNVWLARLAGRMDGILVVVVMRALKVNYC